MGITSGKLHLRLDAPPLDVKIYLFDLARSYGLYVYAGSTATFATGCRSFLP